MISTTGWPPAPDPLVWPPPSAPAPASRTAPASAPRGGRRGSPSIGFSSRQRLGGVEQLRSLRRSGPRAPAFTSERLDVGQELVQRRVEQPDDDRAGRPSPRGSRRSPPAARRGAPRAPRSPPRRRGQDHPSHDRQAVLAEKHVLGAAQPDPLGPEPVGRSRRRGRCRRWRARRADRARIVVRPVEKDRRARAAARRR